MKIIRDKRAMALPFVLGIVTFVVGVVATLISYAVFQSKLIAKNIESTETYINAVQAIDATIHIIIREQNLDPTFLSNLATYMDVSITQYNDTVWMISSVNTQIPTITSYITGDGASVSVMTEQFSYTGLETNFIQNPLIDTLTLVSAYVPQFLTTNFPTLSPPTEFTSFYQLMMYIDSLSQFTNKTPTSISNLANPTVTGHWYVTGSLTLSNYKNLTIPDGYLLFINGNLTMNRGSTLSGNVIISGSLIISGLTSTTQYIRGTVYSGGSMSLNQRVDIGTSSRPTFLISDSSITIGTRLTGYGYLFGTSVRVDKSDIVSLYGGTYPADRDLSTSEVMAYASLDSANFYDYAIPVSLTDPNTSGELVFKFTSPK